MMTNDTEQLPEDIQITLNSTRLIADICNISTNFGLDTVSLWNLYFLTQEILRGNMQPETFVQNISDQLNISQEHASRIAQAVNHIVFTPIKDSLLSVYGFSSPDKENSDHTVSHVENPGQHSSNENSVSILEQKLGATYKIEPSIGGENTTTQKIDPYREPIE